MDVVARSICSLRPGVAGLSETIRVRSVLGRYLEHSRVFLFESPDSRVILMGSADLMPRNLDNRVEVVVPVEDERAQQEIVRVFDALLDDNADAWDLDGGGCWSRARPRKARSRSAQTVLMRDTLTRARRSLTGLSR